MDAPLAEFIAGKRANKVDLISLKDASIIVHGGAAANQS